MNTHQFQQNVEILDDEHQLNEHEALELIQLEGTIHRGIEIFREVGEALFAIRDKRLYRATHATFDSYCRDRWKMSRTQANRLIGAADVAKDLAPIGAIPSSESVARPLVPLSTDQRQEAWQQAVLSTPNGKPTASNVLEAAQKISKISHHSDNSSANNGQHALKEYIEEIVLEDGRKLFVKHSLGTIAKLNRTNEMVDWAWWTLNPVTGCWHNCDYCYARDIANRFYNTKFEPTFYPDRLSAPANTKVPDEAATDVRAKNIFVSSMGDLFGKWVPNEWILQVFEMVKNNPQWNFLFLTKFPQRLQEINDVLEGFPDNAWVGTTVDTQKRVRIAEEAFKNIKAEIKWLSCEPLLEHLTFNSLEMFDWVVIGGQSKSSQTPAFQPEVKWVSDLLQQAVSANCKIYLKENLIVKETPW